MHRDSRAPPRPCPHRAFRWNSCQSENTHPILQGRTLQKSYTQRPYHLRFITPEFRRTAVRPPHLIPPRMQGNKDRHSVTSQIHQIWFQHVSITVMHIRQYIGINLCHIRRHAAQRRIANIAHVFKQVRCADFHPHGRRQHAEHHGHCKQECTRSFQSFHCSRPLFRFRFYSNGFFRILKLFSIFQDRLDKAGRSAEAVVTFDPLPSGRRARVLQAPRSLRPLCRELFRSRSVRHAALPSGFNFLKKV